MFFKLEKTLRHLQQNKDFLHSLLYIPTYALKTAIKTRNFLYDKGLKKCQKAFLPVVSIGNIAVGGTGKTPFTIFLAKALHPYFRVAILTRGYRSLAEKRSQPTIVSFGDGKPPVYSPDIVGDEAFLMARNLPNTVVISGKNRFLAALEAKKLGATLVLLDDGMQHRQLFRNIEIAMIDGREGEKKFLPLGSLRDDPKRLERVDFLVKDMSTSTNSVNAHARAQKRSMAIGISWRVVGIIGKAGKIRESLSGMPVAIFCGIACPERFLKTVEECGTRVVDALFLADHEKMEEQKLNSFAKEAQAKGALILLCTEKDFVKYENTSLPLPLMWVKREMYITENQQLWNTMIQRIKELV